MPGKPFALCVETSSAQGSLSLFDISKPLAEPLAHEVWQKSGSHSERITMALMGALVTARCELEDLTQIVVGVGPGSFTGIRVGVNFSKALAYARRVPIYSLNSLRVMAESSLGQQGSVLCVINAYRKFFYCAGYKFENQQCLEWLSPSALRPEEISQHLAQSNCVLLDSTNTLEELSLQLNLGPEQRSYFHVHHPNSMDLWRARLTTLLQKCDWNSLVPLYIRASDAEEKLHEGVLKAPHRL